ncbi:MAG: serine hydrolase, partial [Calditrichaeota bacterium]|nr:serine hydrolase [Calditrichota bacterium]
DRIKSKLTETDFLVFALFSRTSSEAESVGIQQQQIDFVREVSSSFSKPTLLISFGSPYIASDFDFIDDHISAYAYSTIMQSAAADAVGGLYPISGKTPVAVPRINEDHEYYFNSNKAVSSDLLSTQAKVKIDLLLTQSIADSVFPGATISIGSADTIYYQNGYGHFTYDKNSPPVQAETRYDLASLTKVFATTISIMKLIDRYQIRLDNTLADLFPEYINSQEKKDITVAQLLTHSSGQVAYKHYFETVKSKEEMYQAIFAEPLIYKPGTQTVYSDLGFILLMRAVETITGKSLDQFVKETFYEPMNLAAIGFLPKEKRLIPPTEAVEWRGHMAQGEVHDENAMSIGGVSGHAGLFANVQSLSAICQLLLKKGVYNGKRYLSTTVIDLFTQKAGVDSLSDRGFGWDKPSAISGAGKYISDQAFGHYGFTGTTVWVDPTNDVFIIHLSNRVYPTRNNIKIRKFRPVFYNLVMEQLGKTKFRESYQKAMEKADN